MIVGDFYVCGWLDRVCVFVDRHRQFLYSFDSAPLAVEWCMNHIVLFKDNTNHYEVIKKGVDYLDDEF